MNRLLAVNFSRWRKDKISWLGMAFMFLYGSLIILSNYSYIKNSSETMMIDNIFFGYAMIVGIAIAVFCSMYIGTDYNDGTIRNKFIMGHARASVYLSNLIVCSVASVLMAIAYIIPVTVMGIPLIGWFQAEPRVIILTLVGTFVMILALASIFTLICMMIQNKAVSAVVATLTIFAMLIMPVFISRYEILFDIVPTAQAAQYAGMSMVHLWRKMLYSLAIILVTTVAGIMVFKRKDIK